jgi:hypothetical protein
MPRVINGSADPLDFCQKCFPKTEESAHELYGDGEGPDDRWCCFAYDADHPGYDCDDYRCCECGKQLGLDDEAQRDYR